MLALFRARVPPEQRELFVAQAGDVLTGLADRPGFRRGRVGRGFDDEGDWVLHTEWESVGAYRRALSAYDVKVALAALMTFVVSEPSAFEVLIDR